MCLEPLNACSVHKPRSHAMKLLLNATLALIGQILFNIIARSLQYDFMKFVIVRYMLGYQITNDIII